MEKALKKHQKWWPKGIQNSNAQSLMFLRVFACEKASFWHQFHIIFRSCRSLFWGTSKTWFRPPLLRKSLIFTSGMWEEKLQKWVRNRVLKHLQKNHKHDIKMMPKWGQKWCQMLAKINPGTVSKRNAEHQRGPRQIHFPKQHLGKHGALQGTPQKELWFANFSRIRLGINSRPLLADSWALPGRFGVLLGSIFDLIFECFFHHFGLKQNPSKRKHTQANARKRTKCYMDAPPQADKLLHGRGLWAGKLLHGTLLDHSVPLPSASCFCLLRVPLACASCSCLLLVPLRWASCLLVFLASAFCL